MSNQIDYYKKYLKYKQKYFLLKQQIGGEVPCDNKKYLFFDFDQTLISKHSGGMPITKKLQLDDDEKNELYKFITNVLSNGHYIFIISRGIASEIAQFLCNIFNTQKYDKWTNSPINEECPFHWRISCEEHNYKIDILGAKNTTGISNIIQDNNDCNQISDKDKEQIINAVDNKGKETKWAIYKTLLIKYVINLIKTKNIPHIICELNELKNVYFFDDTSVNVEYAKKYLGDKNALEITAGQPDKLFEMVYGILKIPSQPQPILNNDLTNIPEKSPLKRQGAVRTRPNESYELVTGNIRIPEQTPPSKSVQEETTGSFHVIDEDINETLPLSSMSYQPNKQPRR
jgi:hypothetical protein